MMFSRHNAAIITNEAPRHAADARNTAGGPATLYNASASTPANTATTPSANHCTRTKQKGFYEGECVKQSATHAGSPQWMRCRFGSHVPASQIRQRAMRPKRASVSLRCSTTTQTQSEASKKRGPRAGGQRITPHTLTIRSSESPRCTMPRKTSIPAFCTEPHASRTWNKAHNGVS